MDSTDLFDYVGASSNDTLYVDQCWLEAQTLVDTFVGTSTVDSTIVERAYLETGSELYHRRNAPSGLSQFASFDGSPQRLARDPMTSSYPILGKGMVIGI